MTNAPAGRGRPRRAETDERIVSATLAVLREHGPEAVNVAAVAARSGIARTTIYRRYRDREELLRAALRPVTEKGSPPQDASVRDKLAWVLRRTEEVLSSSIGVGGVASLLVEKDPEFSTALRSSLRSGLEPILQQIRADVEQGRLAAHVDPDTLVNLILGSYLAERLRYGSPRTGWRQRTADVLAASFARDPSARPDREQS